MNLPTMSLLGRTALVTGAATGIGRATARLFAQAGARVVVNHWRQAPEAQALLAQIVATGGEASAVEADVSDAAAVQALADAVGAVDVLVNNAGIIQEKAFLDTTEADWDRMMAVDLKAVFLVCRAFIPGMLSKGQGAIVNIASDLGILGRERYAPYCAAKAGVIGLTKSLAREFAPQRIRANAVAPGPVATAMVSLEHMSAEWVEKELAIPQHRLGAPEEIADSVLFLASDLSRFYTGQVLGPNGGSVMP